MILPYHINLILDLISQKNIFQKKSVTKFLESWDNEFKNYVENYFSTYFSFLEAKKISIEEAVNAYLKFSSDSLIEQTLFLKTGKYRFSTLEEVEKNVYANPEYMRSYMIGVALSQFFWKNHNQMFLFFKKHIENLNSSSYLEIGSGHGLFLLETIAGNGLKDYTVVDISETSLNLTKEIVHFFAGKDIYRTITFLEQDVTNFETAKTFDFITMGEVLEHVEQPKLLLNSINKLLSTGGKTYISTCTNAPVIDHIYLYNSIGEIREHITGAGLKIVEEIIICNDNTLPEEWEIKKANLSYACIAEKQA